MASALMDRLALLPSAAWPHVSTPSWLSASSCHGGVRKRILSVLHVCMVSSLSGAQGSASMTMYFQVFINMYFSGGVKRSLLETQSVCSTPSVTPSKGRTSLVVWWLTLLASRAQGPGLIPGQGTGSHMRQLRPASAK